MKKMSSTAWIVLFVWLLDTCCHVSATTRPIIGVLAQETYHDECHHGDMYIPCAYVNFIQSGGARVVPILIGQTEDYYNHMLKSINGVLFPGGRVSLEESDFYTKGKFIYDWAIKANDAGDYFPMWGACLGFELFAVITGGSDVLTKTFEAKNVYMPLNFTKRYRDSKLFGNVPQDVEQYLKNENSSANFHKKGLSPKTYINNDELRTFYHVLSTNMDLNGHEFISTMEAYRYPFYAVQWHPEKGNFVWSINYNITNSEISVKLSQYMANFFVGESRKSNHAFPDLKTEIAAMIYNYDTVFFKSRSFDSKYYFNFSDVAISQPSAFEPSSFFRTDVLLLCIVCQSVLLVYVNMLIKQKAH